MPVDMEGNAYISKEKVTKAWQRTNEKDKVWIRTIVESLLDSSSWSDFL